MPGFITITTNSGNIAELRYDSANERKSILSFLNLLYAFDKYTLTILPDDCTVEQTSEQVEKAGCTDAYCRVLGLRGTYCYPCHSLAS
jgi:hypothetical protein